MQKYVYPEDPIEHVKEYKYSERIILDMEILGIENGQNYMCREFLNLVPLLSWASNS